MIVVSDTSLMNNLAAIGQLGLLQQLYGNVIIPTAVYIAIPFNKQCINDCFWQERSALRSSRFAIATEA
jgi:predicted nucleic acid-binding protein